MKDLGVLDERDYEDGFGILVEYNDAISPEEARALERVYDAWAKRIEEASFRAYGYESAAQALAAGYPAIRVTPLEILGNNANGGVLRFGGGSEEALLLLQELAKRNGIVHVRFT